MASRQRIDANEKLLGSSNNRLENVNSKQLVEELELSTRF